jgi:hypothetical protein
MSARVHAVDQLAARLNSPGFLLTVAAAGAVG